MQETARIRIRLREMLERFEARTGLRLTYDELARMTGLSRATVASLATRPAYNASLATIAKVCRALGCTPGELLDIKVHEGEVADRARR